MKPVDAFDATMQRVERLFKLYELLQNRRKRGTRRDWADKFKKLMHWPQNETIHRIDGVNTILVLRKASAMTPDQFRHDELSELLRAALVTTVSAFDRYCHDVLISRLMAQIGRPEEKWSPELRKVTLPLPWIVKAIDHAKTRKGRGGSRRPRPMNIVRHALQDQFHQGLILQRSDKVASALSMIGVKNLWKECSTGMNAQPEEIKKRLDAIVDRRNRIVHEGDVKRVRRGGRVTLTSVELKKVQDDVGWLRNLVKAMEAATA